MHPSVQEWVAAKVQEYELADSNTLEVGSRNYNGTVRKFFRGEYVGVDMEPGRDVDIVARADKLPFKARTFDTVVSTEMLEHDPCFWLSIPEMVRVLKPKGHLLLTTRGIGFQYHEYPGDFWRFTQDSIPHLFEMAGLQTLELTPDPYPDHPGWFGLAVKP